MYRVRSEGVLFITAHFPQIKPVVTKQVTKSVSMEGNKTPLVNIWYQLVRV